MKVGVMTRALRKPVTGVGRYTLNLVRELASLMPPSLLTLFVMHEGGLDDLRCRKVKAPFSTSNEIQRLLWEQTLVPIEVQRHQIQLYHSPNHVLPLALTCKSVVTVHDLSFLERKLFNWRKYLYLNLLTPLSIKRADHLIAVSKFTKAELEARFPSTIGKISVVYEALDPTWLRPPSSEETTSFRERKGLGPFVLFVGTIEPRKNLTRLIKAFEQAVCMENLPHQLVFCGPFGWRYEDVLETWRHSPVRDRLRYVGYASAEELRYWYAAADLLAYPSLFEGFGLPPLEAMASGTPVVTSNCSAIPEVVGDAAIVVDPKNVSAIADGMAKVLTDPMLADDLRERGYERCRQFSWRKAALETMRVYEDVLGRGS